MSQNSKEGDRPVCLVTGGSSGIGLAAARRFAADGFQVAIAARGRDRLEAAASEVSASGNLPCAWFCADFRDAAAPDRLIASVIERLGRLDVVVNSAGVACLTPAALHDPEAFDEMWRVNGLAFARLCRAAWPVFQRQSDGAIVHVSSMSAFDAYPGLGTYGATKAWANHLVRTLAEEGRPFNVRAFAVCPGAVETPMLRRLYPDFPPSQALAPEAVAAVIRLLCEPAMSAASGNAITVRR
jgi:3-oxoacyl-[acyl-carrier protein] reductase